LFLQRWRKPSGGQQFPTDVHGLSQVIQAESFLVASVMRQPVSLSRAFCVADERRSGQGVTRAGPTETVRAQR
jgi:hypothetical protein